MTTTYQPVKPLDSPWGGSPSASNSYNSVYQSSGKDNTVDQYDDVFVFGGIYFSWTMNSTGWVELYAWGKNDYSFSSVITSSGGVRSFPSEANRDSEIVHVANLRGQYPSNKALIIKEFSIVQALGYMPKKWGIAIVNRSGAQMQSYPVIDAQYIGVKYT